MEEEIDSKQSVKGTSNVLKKLENSILEGKYYEAQQMYKTVYFRYLKKKQINEVIELLHNGAIGMLKHKRTTEASELANLLIKTYNENNIPVSPESLQIILDIFNAYDESEIDSKENFMKAAINWSASHGKNKQGEPLLYNLLGKLFYKHKNYGKAQKYYIRGTEIDEFVSMLTEYASSVLPSEVDLIIARAVLQYLCLSDLKNANLVFENFQKQNPNLPQTPLINFIRFLLLTLERDALPLFRSLRQTYKPSLDRDPTFQQYLDRIATVFYNVKSSGGFLESMLGSLLGSN